MTKVHKDRIEVEGLDKGLSIRVGKKLPQNSANLAYVASSEITPDNNLTINDLSSNIKENGLPITYLQEKVMYPQEDFLLKEVSGDSELPSQKIILTDEFSVPLTSQEKPGPLYYCSTLAGLFDAKGSLVAPYLSGYSERPVEKVMDFSKVSQLEKENLLYLGNKISVVNSDGTSLESGLSYKIHLVATEGEGIPVNAYNVYIYTNFRNSTSNTYIVKYEKYESNGSHLSDYSEVLNALPFFDEVDKQELDELALNPKNNNVWKEELTDKKFSIVESANDAYQVYAPAQLIVANSQTRPAHQFKYRLKANLKTKFSSSNIGELKVGVVFLNNSVINVEDLTSVMKKVNEDSSKPPYLTMTNPHPPIASFLKENPRYWTANLNMPKEEWNDYDLIILTGYGFYDMTPHNDSIRNYLEHGGKLWIDNAGETGKVLTFTNPSGVNTFLLNVSFSNTANSTGVKSPDVTDDAKEILNRLYTINGNTVDLGYANEVASVNPRIEFGDGESLASWNKIVRYANNSPSIMKKTYFEKGTVVVSNCGLLRSLFYGKELDIKFIMNMVLTLAESKWIYGPWQQEYVYHRDNLFKEEYKAVNGITTYIDDKSDFDENEIVTKKIINKSVKSAMLSFVPPYFYNGRGVYQIETESNTEIAISNNSFESGHFDSLRQEQITHWTGTVVDAIPGWSTKHLAGSTPQFEHITSTTQRGFKAVQITGAADSIGTNSYWSYLTEPLVAGTYTVKAWLKTEHVQGLNSPGATVSVYGEDGVLISSSVGVIGSRDWSEVSTTFTVPTMKKVELRLGFGNGNSTGTVLIDYVSMLSLGSVAMTPQNDGSSQLYAYALKPRGDIFDLKAQGFLDSDITTFDPELSLRYTIRAFVYGWDNETGRYVKIYGNYVTRNLKIRRSDGIVNLGALTTIIPALNSGSDWADRNDVYYEVFVGDMDGQDDDSKLVNIELYNTETGKYYYSKTGEIVIRYKDFFYEENSRSVILQARTSYYTIRATKRRYGVLVQPENKVALEYPATEDNRDGWYLRIQNGSFVKKELNYSDIKSLLEFDNRYYQFQQRIFGTHHYSIPEYKRQVFDGAIGVKRVLEETAEYVDDKVIKVQNTPLIVRRGTVSKELVAKIDNEGIIYKAINENWLEGESVRVFLDEDLNGHEVELTEGYSVDAKEGLIIFAEPVNGLVKVSYSYNNLSVTKRSFANASIKSERIASNDGKTFETRHKNLLMYPSPVVKQRAYDSAEIKVVPITAYTIDYSSGVVKFIEEMHDIITIDYSYSKDIQMEVSDFDAINGLIYLKEPIDFKQEFYVDYSYEEAFLEYRGYYDAEIGQFIHLDLNPSEGHYSTVPVVRRDDVSNENITSWEEAPSSTLMNKEVYVYILPHKDSFGNYNEHTVRHVLGLENWQFIQKTTPTALLLGTVYLREHITVSDVVVMDARTRGGGLKESVSDAQIKKVQKESSSYWDMESWDGKAYYKNGVLVVELPKKVLTSNGGQFTEEQVRTIVGKHVAYGVYPIIEFI